MNKQRNGVIDLLRIGSATLIVLHHYQQGVDITLKHISFYGGVFNFGYIVELFFLISGLMIYKSIIEPDADITFKSFMGGRLKRIIPLLTISVFVETILRYISEYLKGVGEFSFNLLDIVVNAVGLQNTGLFSTNSINQPTWYLSVLLLCYLWLFIITNVSKRLKISPYYGYAIMIILGIAINTYSWNTLFLNRNLSRGYFSFFIGLFLARYFEKVKRNKGELISFIFSIGFLILLKIRPHFLIMGDFYFYVLLFWIPILILSLRWFPMRTKSYFLLSSLGKASFGVYIWNEPMSCLRNIIAMVFGVNLNTISAMTIFVVLNWQVGICSYLLIEKPLNKWFKKVFRKE